MKKGLFIGLIALLSLGFSGCSSFDVVGDSNNNVNDNPSIGFDDDNNVNNDDTPNVQEKYKVYWYNGDILLLTNECKKGDTPIYTSSNKPTKEGYTFIGWNSDPNASVALNPLPKITKDTPFYAIFASSSSDEQSDDNDPVTPIDPVTPVDPVDPVTPDEPDPQEEEPTGPFTIEELQADKRYLTAQGDGYTYLDYYKKEQFKSWNDLISEGYITSQSYYFTENKLDELGKGILKIPITLNSTYGTLGGDSAFLSNKLLDGIVFPANARDGIINDAICSGNNSIRTIEFTAPPSGYTNNIIQINLKAFKNCTSLESVIFNNKSISRIRSEAFYGCNSLKSIDISSFNTLESEAFANCTELSSVIGLSTSQTIGSYCFSNCSKLNSINGSSILSFSNMKLPSGIFSNTAFTKLNISASEIGKNSFKQMEQLTEATLTLPSANLPDGTFNRCSKLATLNLNVPYDNSLTNSSTRVDNNTFSANTDDNTNNFCFYSCSNLKQINFSGTVDQFMSYYKSLDKNSWDYTLRFDGAYSNNSLEIKCAKGYFKKSLTTEQTINKNNWSTYASDFGISS